MSTPGPEDRELEEIRRRKLLELQRKLEEEQRLREEQARLEAQREALLRRLLTPAARDRLANVKLVKPELARAVEDAIIQLVQVGRLVPPVGEDVVKSLLIEIDSRTRREPRVRFKRK